MVGEVKEQEIKGSWMVMSLHPFSENHVHKITATLYIQPCKYPCHKANNHLTGVHIIFLSRKLSDNKKTSPALSLYF